MATELVRQYGQGELKDVSSSDAIHEAGLLTLDITKARTLLGWQPALDFKETVTLVADWYRRYAQEDVYHICVQQIDHYGEMCKWK